MEAFICLATTFQILIVVRISSSKYECPTYDHCLESKLNCKHDMDELYISMTINIDTLNGPCIRNLLPTMMMGHKNTIDESQTFDTLVINGHEYIMYA